MLFSQEQQPNAIVADTQTHSHLNLPGGETPPMKSNAEVEWHSFWAREKENVLFTQFFPDFVWSCRCRRRRRHHRIYLLVPICRHSPA